MHPLRLLLPALLTVFHVTNRGYSEVADGSGLSCLRRRRPMEKIDDLDEEDLEVADEFSVAMDEFVEGKEDDEED
jgi:hypothetical protein